MSASRFPLGKVEDQGLEFKSRDSLGDRHAIGREVVGMLNAERGGEIWIGLAEEGNRAVEVESIPDAEAEARALQDFLMDRLEPAPAAGEIVVEAVPTKDEERGVIRIQVKGQPDRRPYALLRKGARIFVTRVGERLRPMAREEILGQAGVDGEDREGRLHEVAHRLFDERERLRKEGGRLLWLRLQPTADPADSRLDLQSPELRELLTDPTRTGNRRQGATFSLAAYYLEAEPSTARHHGQTVLELGPEGGYLTRVYPDGGIEVEAPLDILEGPPVHPGHGNDVVLSSVRLAEYVASVFRLMRGLLTASDEPAESEIWMTPVAVSEIEVVTQFALFVLRGVYLMTESSCRSASSPWPAELPGLHTDGPRLEPYPEDDFTLDRALIATGAEVLDNPDRLAFRILRELFEAYCYPESEMPHELDRKTGRLVLPE